MTYTARSRPIPAARNHRESRRTRPKPLRSCPGQPRGGRPRLACATGSSATVRANWPPLIRLQCRLDNRAEPENDTYALERTIGHLLDDHAVTWLGARPRSSDFEWEYIRGFPEGVTFASVTALEKAKDSIFRFPVRRLSFTSLRSVARLARLPGAEPHHPARAWVGERLPTKPDCGCCSARRTSFDWNGCGSGPTGLVPRAPPCSPTCRL